MGEGYFCRGPLYNQHGIAIGEEGVFFVDGFLVCLHDKIVPTKGRNHHQHGRNRQMKVGNHGIRNREVVRRENEFIGPAFISFYHPIDGNGCFEGFHGSGTYRANFMTLMFCCVDGLYRGFLNVHFLGIHFVFGEVFHFDGSKVPKPSVQCNLSKVNAFYFEPFQ